MTEQITSKQMAKAKSRQRAKNAGHAQAQFITTYRNKLRRVIQSNGKEAAARYTAEFYPLALSKSSRKRV